MNRICLIAVAAACPAPVFAQAAVSEVATDRDAARGARVYTYDDLKQYAPQTALDMVARIPGFQLSGGGGGNRGLGQANQNVLINGERIAAKSTSAADALQRIDSRKVIRIEILDGATLDVPGLSGEVANIVYEAGGVSGTWGYNAQFRSRIDDTLLDGNASLSGGNDRERWSVSVRTNQRRQGNYGPETLFDANGEAILTRDEIGRFDSDSPEVQGSYSKIFSGGDELAINGSAQLVIARNRTDGAILPVNGDPFDERSTSGEDEWNAELGANYAFDLGIGRLKLIGLQRLEHSPTYSEFGIVGGDDARFEQVVDESESIGRAEYGWKAGVTDYEVAIEGAYNSLDSQSFVLTRPLERPEARTDFPDNLIEEYRGEAIASVSRPLSSDLSLQLNGGAEYSRISAGGADPQNYFEPKGAAAVSWRASERITVDAQVERIVDQLNFFDFLASVDLQDDNDRSRNDQIAPPTRIRVQLDAIVKLGEYGSVTPSFRHQWFDGIIRSIPISPTQEALGNAGSATQWRLGAEGTLLLAPLGVPGARIDFGASIGDSSFRDPLLGTRRALGGQNFAVLRFDYRHDIAGSNIAYGFDFFTEKEEGRFRLDQFADRYSSKPRMSLFVEHKDIFGVQVTAGVTNLLNARDRFERIIYADRRDGPVAFREFQNRAYGRAVLVNLSGRI